MRINGSAKKTKAVDIMEQLRQAINNGEYASNETITEAQIAQRFSVSITPAREALAMLSMEGYIQKVPHRGYLVRGVTLKETQMLYELRSILEEGVISLAIHRAAQEDIEELIREAEELAKCDEAIIRSKFRQYNYEFHLALANTTGNDYLISTYSDVMNKLWRAMAIGSPTQDVRRSLQTHIDLCKAILSKDERLADKLFRYSIGGSLTRVVERIGGRFQY